MTTSTFDTAAKAVAEARASVSVYELPQGLGGAPFDEAYAFQDAYVAAVGKPVAGYKLAVNGAPQQKHFGVDAPAAARIFAGEVHDSGVALPKADYDAVSIEPEIAAVLGEGVSALSGTVDRAGALAAIDRFHPAIELIDQRGYAVPALELAQAIALNVFNAGIVLGPESIAPGDLDLASMQVTLDIDGTRVGDTVNTAPQHPLDAVVWLLNHLVAHGLKAEPGMVIMCGTHLPLMTLKPDNSRVDVQMSGLGGVSFSLS